MSSSKIMNKLAKDPRAMMKFQTTGQLPRMRDPLSTPLLELLKKISPRDRMAMEGVQLSPKLGYNNGTLFKSAEHLFQWLGGHTQRGEWETLPSESFAIRSFQKRLSLDDLKQATGRWPEYLDRRHGSSGPSF